MNIVATSIKCQKPKRLQKDFCLHLPLSPLNSHYLDLPSITGYPIFKSAQQASKVEGRRIVD